LQKLPINITAKNLLESLTDNLDFTLQEIDYFFFLGIIAEKVESFLRIFFDFGLVNEIPYENPVVTTKWNGEIQKAINEIFDSESLMMTVLYMKNLQKQSNIDEDFEN